MKRSAPKPSSLGPKPKVAIVGRPNVGKSTLFNRLVGRKQAIVRDVAGVTRDRQYGDAVANGRAYEAIDTGGFLPDEREALLVEVRRQAEQAMEEADVVLLVVDGRGGATTTDQSLAEQLRRGGRPVLLVVNKVDDPKKETLFTADFHAFGLSELFPVSAEHARGFDELETRIAELLPPEPEQPEAPEGADEIEDGEDDRPRPPLRLAILGRPNVGKSTLVNSLLGEERVVASPIPGTTRDPIDSSLEWRGHELVLTDTAGIRRKRSVYEKLEQDAIVHAVRALERADVAILLLDASEPAVDQDAKLIALAEDRGRAIVLVVNKWDLVAKEARKEAAYRATLKERFSFISYAPVVLISALRGEKIDKVLEAAIHVGELQRTRVSTPKLNNLLEAAIDRHPPPAPKGRQIKLRYMTQVATRPPTFVVRCNHPTLLPDSYHRHLVNRLREAFGLRVPIRLLVRGKDGGSGGPDGRRGGGGSEGKRSPPRKHSPH